MDKTLIHVATGVIIGAGVAAIGLTGGVAIVGAAVVGWAAGNITDSAYDAIRKPKRNNTNNEKK
ncbi:hypothetical protein [Enterococcus sp. DIV0187]|uniref:hypothetical protein n=1 Tax=Enterococcus sp. DIV0187 TaxID=2774644 RepID=UPI003F1FE291